jgi:prepilin-type N-terminal cleavage/methylation domain-containing protein
MPNRTYSSRSGFTLLELLAAILVISIISATLMPVIASASDSFTVARDARYSTEKSAFALDRIVRIVRQAPIGADDTGVGITSATQSSVEFSDGTGVRLVGTTLEMLVPGENSVPLCLDVESFTVLYYANDGVSSTILTPSQTHRFGFMIVTENVEMTVLAHPRVWIGQVPL